MDAPKVTDWGQNADFRRIPKIFADAPLVLEVQALGGHRKPQETAYFCRKLMIFPEHSTKPQIGVRHPRSVTLRAALETLANTRTMQLQDLGLLLFADSSC